MNKNLDIVWTNQFKKDYKLAMKRSLNIDLLDNIIRKLASGEQLPEKNKDHALTGNWVGHRECHILSVTECFGSGFFWTSDCSGVRTLPIQ